MVSLPYSQHNAADPYPELFFNAVANNPSEV
jgi:hypothetical protein